MINEPKDKYLSRKCYNCKYYNVRTYDYGEYLCCDLCNAEYDKAYEKNIRIICPLISDISVACSTSSVIKFGYGNILINRVDNVLNFIKLDIAKNVGMQEDISKYNKNIDCTLCDICIDSTEYYNTLKKQIVNGSSKDMIFNVDTGNGIVVTFDLTATDNIPFILSTINREIDEAYSSFLGNNTAYIL